MYFKDETNQEWLVDLHDAMTGDTLDFLADIKKGGVVVQMVFYVGADVS